MKLFKILLFLILGLFPFGQLTRIPLGIPGINIYFHDLVIGTLVLTWFFYHLLAKKSFPRPPLTKPILAFFLVATLSLVINLPRLQVKEALVASLYLWRWIFYAGVYFALQEGLAYGEDELKQEKHSPFEVSKKPHPLGWGECYFDTLDLRWGLVLAGVGAAVFGLIQYFLYPDLTNLAYLGWDPHRYRVFGTFFDPGFLGMILVLTLILIIVGMSKIVTHRLLISFILYLLSYISLALTYSRASYLAYLVGIGVIAWVKKTPKFFLTAFLVGVLTILLLPRPPASEAVRLEREESAWARIRSWRQSLTIAKDNPVLGVGFNAYRYVQRQYGFLKEDWQESHAGAGADSSLFFILATTGILGFLAYTWLLYDILIYHMKNPAVFPSIIALLVHSFFNNSLFYPWIMIWMWILLASSPTANR